MNTPDALPVQRPPFLTDTRRVLLLALWIPLTFTLILAFLARQAQFLHDSDSQWVLHTVEVKDQLEYLDALVNDVETAQRGYLLTGNTVSLASYKKALNEIPAQVQHLALLVADNPRQVASARNLRNLVEEKLTLAAQSLKLAQEGKLSDAVGIVRNDRGKQLEDQIRSQVDSMAAEEDGLLILRKKASDTELNVGNDFMIGLVLVDVALIAGVTLLTLRMQKSRKKAELRARQAAKQTQQAHVEADQAVTQTEQANTRTEEANTRAEEAEAREGDAIRVSELRYRRLFETAQDGILILDAGTGQVVDANPFMKELLGYSQEEILGRKLWEIGPFKGVDASKIAFAELQHTDLIRYEALPLETKDGKRVEVEFISNAYLVGRKRLIQCNIRNITERKKLEQQMVLLDTCVSHLSDIVLLTDAEQGEKGPRIVFANKAFERLTGYTSAETLGQCPRFLQGEKTDPRAVAEIHEAVEKQQPIRRQLINYRKDGTEFWLDIDIAPIFDDAGKCSHFAAIERDITKTKEIEESLNLFRTLMERSPDAIEVIDPQTGRYLDVNETACRRLGYSREEMLSLCLTDILMTKEYPFPLHAKVEEIRKAGFKTFESRHRRKDGSTFPIEVNVQHIDLNRGYLVAVVRDITGRKQADEARQATEERYRALFEYAPDGILITDSESHCIDANASLCRMLGYTRDELEGQHGSCIVGPEEIGRIGEALDVIKAGKHYQHEWKLRRKDGSVFEADLIATMMPDGNLLAMIRDITDRKRSEARFRRLLDSNAQGVVFWNTKGGITSANDAFLRITGYTRQDLDAGRVDWRAMTPEKYAAADLRALEQIAATGVGPPYEKEFIRKDGSRVSIFVGSAVFEDNRDEGVSFVLDLSESKRAEGQIAEQAALLDKAQDAILVRDMEGRVLFWNKGAERLYGWSREEAIGRHVCDLYYADPEKFEESNSLVTQQGELHAEFHHLTKDRRNVTVEGRWSLILDDEGRPKSVLKIDTDITERKNLENQFMRAQRMESIGTLASGVAHDLNNILAPIMMSIEILSNTSDDPEKKDLLETLRLSAQKGADIVRQVLSFARGVEGQRIEVQPKHLLKELESIVKSTFPKNIRMHFSLAEGTWTIRGDPTQVHQILLNLCVNARDAMPEGGSLVIAVENRVLDEHYAAMNIQAKPGHYIQISVTDSGTGIPKDVVERIFEPFFTTKELADGTGLGLSTAMAIVKSHEGYINVYSEPGKGTTFNVYLPSMEMSPEARREQAEEDSLPRGNSEMVLVVDDEASILRIISETLKAFGYRVLTAADGAEAVATYAEHRHDIAVVLTDMSMPVMDGPATIRALMRINPTVKIIAASGLSANGDRARGAGTSVKHFLAKPYRTGLLLKVLRTILQEG